jgi:adenine-specific DNA-methyltransferase
LLEKYRNSVDCCYIDPPYNTGGRDFLYKDSYQHSSWLSMMADRLSLNRELLKTDGALFSTIDDNEFDNLNKVLSNTFGESNFVTSVCWQKKVSPANDAKWFSSDHDHVFVFAKDKSEWRPNRLPRSEEQNQYYTNTDNDSRGPWNSVAYISNKSKEERPNSYYPITNPNTGEEVWPDETAVWKYSEETHEQHVEDDLLYWGQDGTSSKPRLKKFLDDAGKIVPRTIWGYDNVGSTQEATTEVKDMFPSGGFSNPKPVRLMKHISRIGSEENETVLDYFAGSGSTAQGLIDLQREDEGRRKYLLVEMAEYFDTLLRPRIQKTVLSSEWDDGTPEDRDGVSHLVKYHRLETYEDALNNITLSESSGPLQDYLEEEVDDYTSGYMLDFESRESASLLSDGTFDEPFSYELKIEQNGTSREPTTIDLVETFHYLLGAEVRQYWHEMYQDRKYVVTECEVDTESGIETVLTAWRPTEDIDYDEEKEWFDDEFDSESYDRVYVNGESQIAQSEPLEITFREKMEESPNVA